MRSKRHGWVLRPAGPFRGSLQCKSLLQLVMPNFLHFCDCNSLSNVLLQHIHPNWMAVNNDHLFKLSFCDLGLFFLQKSHMQEQYCRPFNDRKRKFVDTELAQDTEGKQMNMQSILPDPSKAHHLTQAQTNQPVYSQINICVPQSSFKI